MSDFFFQNGIFCKILSVPNVYFLVMKKSELVCLFCSSILNLFQYLTCIFAFTFIIAPSWGRDLLPLNGEWRLSVDGGKKEDRVTLPGTMDEWGQGNINTNRNETTHLSRLVTFEGEARYQKEVNIPESFRGKSVFLHLERTKKTTLLIDGEKIGVCDTLQAPQRYDLTSRLTPGSHTLTLIVDNRKSHYPGGVGNSHALVEHTQTNWNGILGDLFLEACPNTFIESVTFSPDLEKKSVSVLLKLQNRNSEQKARIILSATLCRLAPKDEPKSKSFDLDMKPETNEVKLEYPMGKDPLLWSEFAPNLYNMSIKLEAGGHSDEICSTFGMRCFSTTGSQFSINGKKTFLRGKHDACVFPLTGYPPMDKKAWLAYLRKASSYGINYIRFHSWTPPEAAFEAADELGIYLQPELPYWGMVSPSQKDVMDFFRREGVAILDAYSSHPSFVMIALGNELPGTDEAFREIVDLYRSQNAALLYAFGSNNYLGREGYKKGEDFLTTCRMGKDTGQGSENHVRSTFAFADAEDGGILNSTYPSTRITYEKAIKTCPIPVIGHETGQFQIYPDYRELEKYTGVLKPWNLEIFRKRIEEKGNADQIDAFHRASGMWAAQCYKADIEIALRTPGFGGFQMLDLQDFPGQGTALVGLLDAFMDSKGIMEETEFSGFCHAVVPLAMFDKYTWTNSETLCFDVKIANYGEEDLDTPLLWKLSDQEGNVIEKGTLNIHAPQGELSGSSHGQVLLNAISKATQLTLTLHIPGTSRENRYSLWVYPNKENKKLPDTCKVTHRMDDVTFQQLCDGATLLWFPDHQEFAEMSVGGMATPDYWNYAMFKGISEGIKKPVSPGTLSLLMNPRHLLFKEFPTEEHTNWQWWSIIKNSRPLIMDAMPHELRPLIQVVDNMERNHKLGLLFELSVGKGKLLVCMTNTSAVLDKPEGKQFHTALLRYACSTDFKPAYKCSPEEFKRLFSRKAIGVNIIKVKNATEYK